MEAVNQVFETWDKLESVLNNEETNTVTSSVRKSSPYSSRPNSRQHEIRSISVCKDSFFRSKRPGSSSSVSRQTSIIIPGLTIPQLQSIYAAKCIDLDIPLLLDQEKRFFSYCAFHFTNRKFCLKESGLGLASAKKIGEIMKNNQEFAYLNLSKNNLKDEGGLILVKSLKKSMNLVHLDISSNEISAEGSENIIKELENHNSLASFDISSHEGLHRNRLGTPGSRSISKILSINQVLAFLNLSGTGLGFEGLEIIINGLKDNKSLIALNLANNFLGPKAIESLAVVLVPTEIRDLNLSLNKIGNEGCEYISLLISGAYDGFSMISKLDLSENEITTKGISKLFAALRINSHIRVLYLQKNLFNKGLSQNLSQCLTENIALESLNLSHCLIKCEGLVGISEGIGKNSGILSLYINNNFIQDKGAEMIAIGLSKNKKLKHIDLSSNKIRDNGGIFIAKALQINSFLETVHLKNNLLKDSSAQVLSEITRFKHNLLKLSLDLNPVNLKYISEIKTNTIYNHELQQKKLVPQLQKIIDKISINESAMEELKNRLSLKQKEKNDAEHKLKSQGAKLENIKETEEQKLKELQDEYESLRESSLKLSKEFDDLQQQLNVFFMQKARFFEEKNVKDAFDKIGFVASDIKILEKKSIIYAETALKEEISFKKNRSEAVLTDLREDLDYQDTVKKSAESTLLMLKTRLDEKKLMIDMIKNPRAFNAQPAKNFLAGQKLASIKKQGSLSPIKSRGGNSPVKTRKIKSNFRNK